MARWINNVEVDETLSEQEQEYLADLIKDEIRKEQEREYLEEMYRCLKA